MKPKKVILEAFRDTMSGELGLGIVGVPRNDETNAATTGVLIAHDLLEHVNGFSRIGTIDDELEALGAIWFIRGQWGDLARDGTGGAYSPEENVASDVVRMFRDFFYGAPVNTYAPRTLACDADVAFRDIIGHAIRDAADEVDDDDPADVQSRLDAYLAVCLPRMRIGWRKASAKYRGIGGALRANFLFWEIADAVAPYAKRCDEGARYKLTYGLDRSGHLFARCEEDYSDY